MKLHNPFKVAENGDSILIMCMTVLLIVSASAFLIICLELKLFGLLVLPFILMFIRVSYAVLKGK